MSAAMGCPTPKIAPSPLAGPANAITARLTHDVLRSTEKKTLDGQLKQAQTTFGGEV